MKSIAKSLSLLSVLALSYGCNEKISPELQTGSSTTVPPTVTPTEYYFRLTNTSPTVLNYVLHRTGAGNQSTDCSITTTTPFSSDLFSADTQANPFDQRTYDMTCFMEAEELALFFNGLDYQIESSMNTCEYIAYTPYGYYDAIPGNSSAGFRGIVCGSDANSPNPADVATYATNNGLVYGAGNTPIGCNQMVDTSVPAALRQVKTIPDDNQTLCQYDHSPAGGSPNSNGQNCDVGRLTFQITELYDSDVEAPYVFTSRPISRSPHNCGGSIAACVNGAIRQLSQLDGSVNGTVLYASELNTSFTKSFELPALLGVREGMYDIVNYRKGLASYHLDYLDYNSGNDTLWGDTNNRSSYDPNLIERWSNNRNASNATIFTAAAAQTVGHTLHGMTATPLAADPFMGISSKVSPFYNFLCMDRGFEVKARIRMVVRDWDRVFPSNVTSMSYISDVFEGVTGRRQDLPSSEEEVPGDGGIYMYFNDKDDWDNLVPMRRSAGAHPQVYAPGQFDPDAGGPEMAYTLWWDPSIFPSEGPR